MAEEGGSAVALEYLRQTTSRISVMPNGVFLFIYEVADLFTGDQHIVIKMTK